MKKIFFSYCLILQLLIINNLFKFVDINSASRMKMLAIFRLSKNLDPHNENPANRLQIRTHFRGWDTSSVGSSNRKYETFESHKIVLTNCLSTYLCKILIKKFQNANGLKILIFLSTQGLPLAFFWCPEHILQYV